MCWDDVEDGGGCAETVHGGQVVQRSRRCCSSRRGRLLLIARPVDRCSLRMLRNLSVAECPELVALPASDGAVRWTVAGRVEPAKAMVARSGSTPAARPAREPNDVDQFVRMMHVDRLRLADAVQRARHRPVGWGGSSTSPTSTRSTATTRIRSCRRARGRVTFELVRVGEHLPPGPQGGGSTTCRAGPGQVLFVMFDEEHRGAGRGAGARDRAAAARAARAHRLQDRDDAAGQRGRHRVRAQRDGPGQDLQAAAGGGPRRPSSATTSSCRRRTATPAGPRSSSRTAEDWDKHAENLVGEDLKVMRRINHLPGTVEAVATQARHAGRARSRPTSPASRS